MGGRKISELYLGGNDILFFTIQILISPPFPANSFTHSAHLMIESESEVAQSCLTLCDPMDCSLPGSSLHGILQADALTSEPPGKRLPASAWHVGDLGSVPGSGRSPGEGNGNPLQYSCLEKPMDRGAWWAAVPSVAKSRT